MQLNDELQLEFLRIGTNKKAGQPYSLPPFFTYSPGVLATRHYLSRLYFSLNSLIISACTSSTFHLWSNDHFES